MRQIQLASRIAVSIALLVLASFARGTGEREDGGGCAVQMAERIQAHYQSVRDLEAKFEQSTHSVSLGGSTLSGDELRRGRMVLAKPDRMRWSYEEPEPSLVVSDGETLWLYDPVAKEVQRLPVLRGYLNGVALQFLMGEGKLLEQFRVSAEHCGDAAVDLELLPRRDASYERLGLRALAETGEVVETRIVDLFGNVTRLSFRDVRINQDPAPELFHFSVPPGTKVIDLARPE